MVNMNEMINFLIYKDISWVSYPLVFIHEQISLTI